MKLINKFVNANFKVCTNSIMPQQKFNRANTEQQQLQKNKKNLHIKISHVFHHKELEINMFSIILVCFILSAVEVNILILKYSCVNNISRQAFSCNSSANYMICFFWTL